MTTTTTTSPTTCQQHTFLPGEVRCLTCPAHRVDCDSVELSNGSRARASLSSEHGWLVAASLFGLDGDDLTADDLGKLGVLLTAARVRLAELNEPATAAQNVPYEAPDGCPAWCLGEHLNDRHPEIVGVVHQRPIEVADCAVLIEETTGELLTDPVGPVVIVDSFQWVSENTIRHLAAALNKAADLLGVPAEAGR